MDERELDCRLTLSCEGGYRAAWAEVCEFVFEQAGRAFAVSDDKTAQALRELGHKLRLRLAVADERLASARIELVDAAPILPRAAAAAIEAADREGDK